MELVNATRKAIDSGPGAADPAVREAAEAVAVMLSLFAPYTAEECWARLRRTRADGSVVARAGWPAVDPALLVEESVTCVVQVQRQGPRPAGGRARTSPRTSCATWRWPRKAWRARWPDGGSSG